MGNQTFGSAYETTEQGLRALDALPVPIRRVYDAAPYKFHMTTALKNWRKAQKAGVRIADYRREVIRMMCNEIQRQAKKGWGKDHPDALRSRLEGRS